MTSRAWSRLRAWCRQTPAAAALPQPNFIVIAAALSDAAAAEAEAAVRMANRHPLDCVTQARMAQMRERAMMLATAQHWFQCAAPYEPRLRQIVGRS